MSDTMTEGVVAKWHKNIGDKVSDGDLLAEIETDKATMEFESYADGYLLYQGVKEGESAPVDAVLAIIGEKGEDISALLQENAAEKKEDNDDNNESATVENTPEQTPEIDLSDVKAEVIRMPKLSDTMTEGVVAKWHKKVGDKVADGDLLAEIETDKATMEFESFLDGYLLYQGVKEGESAPVDAILAIIGEKDADYSKILEAEKYRNNAQSEKTAEAPKPVKETKAEQKQDVKKSSATVTTTTTSTEGKRIKASPLAKKLAKEKGINLALVKGTGEGGRIIKRDIENYQGGGMAMAAAMHEGYKDVPVSQMRKTIARRLSESKFTAPHFYLTMEIDMDNAVETRKAINTVSPVKISFNDMVVKAAAAALRQHPKVNASWLDDRIRYYDHIHVGVAVAVDEGLLVPVVRFADQKPLSAIASEVKTYAEKAKNKQLQPQDWEGNTFTISNLGMFGIEEFTAIINPPDACIMAVGAIKQVPVVKNGQIVPGNRMKVTLSCDHRVVDGAVGSAFLQTFKNYMENPVLFLGAYNI
ncbi:MAG TPA: pyruvate dehydrogenase complex dihydrolipoamide acetyltransferase [Flavobacteriales bacterium]|nr:pyruvate dehydrogenase complex dihydrolipoamide acetyltransferase [Flavobacteriales bacterium]